MTHIPEKNSDADALALTLPKTRRGLKLYGENPFIPEASEHTKKGVKKISSEAGDKLMIVNRVTGEMTSAEGSAGFWQYQEIDRTQFVKLYVNGVKALKELTGAGTKMFEIMYSQVSNQIGKDQIYLSFNAIDQKTIVMSEATYARGMRELVAKSFIAPSLLQGWYFINPDYIWNGDRMAFVKEYRIKIQDKAKKVRGKEVDPRQIELLEPPQIDAENQAEID